MDLPLSPYQNQLPNNALSLAVTPATHPMMGLSPLQVQPQSQPDQEQAAILTRIKQRSYTDPDNEGRFLYNLFVIQYFKSFQRNASEVELHLRHGGINEVKENVVQLQLSSDLTEEEMSFFPPFICVEHSVVCAWLQNSSVPHSGYLQVNNIASSHGRDFSMFPSASRSPSRNARRGSRSGSRALAPDEKLRYTCGEFFLGKKCVKCKAGFVNKDTFTDHLGEIHREDLALDSFLVDKERCCRLRAAGGVQSLYNHVSDDHVHQFTVSALKKANRHRAPSRAPPDHGRRTSSANSNYTIPGTLLSAVPHSSQFTQLQAYQTIDEPRQVTPNHAAPYHHQSVTIPSVQWPAPGYEQQPVHGTPSTPYYP